MPAVAPGLPPPRRDSAAVRAELGAVDRPLVLAVGRLEPQKRLGVLVDAVAGWAGPDAPVVVVAGTGSLEDRLREQIRTRAAPVQLLGRRDDIADLLAAADIVAMPSAWEGYPLVAQEALRAGTPLVATPVGGVPNLVGDAALLVPPDDPMALRKALEELLADPDRRARYAERGRARAAGWPTEDDMVDELIADYERVISLRS